LTARDPASRPACAAAVSLLTPPETGTGDPNATFSGEQQRDLPCLFRSSSQMTQVAPGRSARELPGLTMATARTVRYESGVGAAPVECVTATP